jgi:integrase
MAKKPCAACGEPDHDEIACTRAIQSVEADDRQFEDERRRVGYLADALAARGLDEATIERLASRLAERPTPRVLRDVALDKAVKEAFVTWLRGNGYTGQCKLSGWHWKALAGHFATLAGASDTPRIEAYKLARLATLRRFYAFAVAQGWLQHPPVIAPMSAKAVGHKLPTSKDGAVETTPEQVETIIGLLPAHASRVRAKGARLTPIRGPFVIGYDHMLRPGQIERLTVPRHWAPGKRELNITEDIDKNRCKRPVPLSARSVDECDAEYRELERQGLIPADGSNVLLFGKFKHSSRPYLKDAAEKAGLPKHEAKHFSSYDFKHSGVTHLGDTPGASLNEISAVSGVSPKTLNDKYLHPAVKHARALVARRDAMRASSSSEDGREDDDKLAEVLDGAHPHGYTVDPPREGGGIGRRTSLRCSLAAAIEHAAAAGRWRLVRELLAELRASREETEQTEPLVDEAREAMRELTGGQS